MEIGSTCGNFFFLQVGVEAEGSDPVGGLDVGSGSGDIMDNEDLLRVSIKGLGGWCWGPGREGRGSDSSDCRLTPWELLALVCGDRHTLPFTSYMFDISTLFSISMGLDLC